LSKLIKAFRLVDSLPRLLTVDNKQEKIKDNLTEQQQAEKFYAETQLIEAAKKEIEILREKALLEAHQQSELILEEAQKQAEIILAQAVHDGEQIKEDAYQQSSMQGLEEGRKKAKEESSIYLEQAKMTLEKACQEKDSMLASLEQEFIELSLAIARKIIKKEVELGTDVIQQIVETAIKKATHREKVIIRVNAVDLEVLEKERMVLREKSASQDLIILPDPTVEAGGCVLETDLGTVDARIDTQFNEIKEVLFKVAKAKEGEEPLI